MQASHSRCGARRGGFIRRIREGGFNGIAATTWDGGVMMTSDRLNDGLLSVGILLKLRRGVERETFPVALSSGKRCSTGHMIVGRCDVCIMRSTV